MHFANNEENILLILCPLAMLHMIFIFHSSTRFHKIFDKKVWKSQTYGFCMHVRKQKF
jgi:hypothetical protein